LLEVLAEIEEVSVNKPKKLYRYMNKTCDTHEFRRIALPKLLSTNPSERFGDAVTELSTFTVMRCENPPRLKRLKTHDYEFARNKIG